MSRTSSANLTRPAGCRRPPSPNAPACSLARASRRVPVRPSRQGPDQGALPWACPAVGWMVTFPARVGATGSGSTGSGATLLGAMQSLSWLDQYPWTVTPSTVDQVDSHTSAISHQPDLSPQVPLTPRKPWPSGLVAASTSSWEMIPVRLARSPALLNQA